MMEPATRLGQHMSAGAHRIVTHVHEQHRAQVLHLRVHVSAHDAFVSLRNIPGVLAG
jgi:hypothetical protein